MSKFTFYSPHTSCESFRKALFRWGTKNGATWLSDLSIPVERRHRQVLNKRVSGQNIGDFLHAQVSSHMVISRCVCLCVCVCVSLGAVRLSLQQHTCGICSCVCLDCQRTGSTEREREEGKRGRDWRERERERER